MVNFILAAGVMLLLVLVAALASCVQGAAVRHEYHAPLTLAPLTSYSRCGVMRSVAQCC